MKTSLSKLVLYEMYVEALCFTDLLTLYCFVSCPYKLYSLDDIVISVRIIHWILQHNTHTRLKQITSSVNSILSQGHSLTQIFHFVHDLFVLKDAPNILYGYKKIVTVITTLYYSYTIF